MKVYYLSADVPLSKTFREIAPGTYKETPYPHVFRFTSIERDVTSLTDFYYHTLAASQEGMCLLKGILDRPLIDESRAGHTDASTPTEWICIDVDYNVIDKTPEEWLDALDPQLKGVSFIFQPSASSGIKVSQGWRGHFFVLLENPVSPQILKQWLISRNLAVKDLANRLVLSASGGALVYPLDVSTCQNDKLLFIAPPTCENFPAPELDFLCCSRTHNKLKFDGSHISAAHNRAQMDAKIASLRVANNLEPKSLKLSQHQGWEILTNPDPVTVTGKREARGFVYLNLNGGDSWAYYFPTSNPDILFNFKGEPCMYMWDVDKDIYNEYANPTSSVEGAIPFGFLWPADDLYYRGFANPQTKELVWIQPTGSKSKLRDFFVQHGIQLPTGWAVDEWNIEFDPSTEGYADFISKTVNTYRRSEYIRNAAIATGTVIPPTIDRVLISLCVEPEIKDHFLNWLAVIFQTRAKTTTAWIFQGVQGTGKGVLFTHIIAPLIGRQYCHEMTMDRLDDDFNAYLANNIVLFIDEAKITDSKNGDRLLNRIKHLVTEPEQHIRAMRTNAIVCRNYTNIILASNFDEIIPLEVTDRRFNVSPRQEQPIQLEYEDIVRIKAELPAFADYLHSLSASHERARKIILTEAREKLIRLSETTIDSFFLAIRSGDLSYFTQYLDSSSKTDIEGVRYYDYALVVKRWIENANQEMNVSRNELRVAYQFLQSTSISTTKFSRMVARYNIEVHPIRIDGQVTRGIHGHVWRLSDEEIELHKEQQQSNVVSLRGAK